jgi:hypothetical protein
MGNNKVSLPDGGWAVLRDPLEVTERQRRPLVRLQRRVAVKAAPHLSGVDLAALSPTQALEKLAPLLSEEDLNALEDIDDLIIATLVDSWSYDPPVSVEGVLDLSGTARSALLDECRPLVGPLVGDTADDEVLDPASPTVPANGSDKP